MRIQHTLVDTCVTATWTLKWFGPKVVTQMVFQVMFVLSDKRTFRAIEHLLGLDMHFGMSPKILLGHGHKLKKNTKISILEL